MKKILQKVLALSLTLALCLSITPVQAADTAAVIRLSKTEGTVGVTNSGGRSLSKRDDMRLYNGYHVTTEAESYAWISLDSTKLNKLDEDSEVEVRKNKKQLELLLDEGNLFFNVTEPLDDDESLNIRTSTMVVGIRGTCGWVKVLDQYNTLVYVLEGTVQCTITDPVSGQSKTTILTGGENARFTVYTQEQSGERCDIIQDRFTEGDIDGFVLAELVGNGPLCEEIYVGSGLDLRNLTQSQVQQRLEADQTAAAEKSRQQAVLEAGKEHNVSINPVWGGQTSNSDSGSGSGGGGGGSAVTPSSVVQLTMPVTDVQIQQALNIPSTRQVIVSPSTDPARNTLEIGIPMAVDSGKTLTLENGVPVQVQGSLTVDGTANLEDNLANDGTITVNSANTLRVGGTLTNRAQMTVTAAGRSITEGTFINTGKLTLTEGARVLAHGFTLTAAVPGWRVAARQVDGYDILEVFVPQKTAPTLTLNFNNGDGSTTVETGSNGQLTGPLPTPADPNGGTFLGWYTEDSSADDTKKVTDETVFTGDTNIYAVWERAAGDFKVTGGTYGRDFSFARDDSTGYGTLTISGTAPLTISMAEGVDKTETDRIFVTKDISANITLDGVNIVLRENGGSALRIANDSMGNVTITVSGDNELTSGQSCAAVEKESGADSGTLTIQGDGTLKATGGGDSNAGGGIFVGGGAGIGAPGGGDTANIVIAGNVRITADSSGSASGIGVSELFGCRSHSVTIRGGTVDGTIEGDDVAVSGGTVNDRVEVSGGDGSFTMTGGTVNGQVEASVGGGSLTMTGGTVNGQVKVGVGSFTMTGGTVNGQVEVSDGSFTMTGGILTGYVRIGSNGVFTKTGGDIRTDGPTAPVPAGWKWEDTQRDGDYYYLVPDTGGFAVEGGTAGTDYTFSRDAGSGLGTLTILSPTRMVVSMANDSPATDRIFVAEDISAKITLDGVNIEVSSSGAAAFEIAENSRGDVSITLVGENTLVSGEFCAGLQKNGGDGMLTIQGNGSLNATGGGGGAGIGGGLMEDGCNITITGSARVTATGGAGASGIGGGSSGIGDYITISGATVTATGGGGAGIGDGSNLETGAARTILLNDSAIVTANRTSITNEFGTFTSAAIGGGVIVRGEGVFEDGMESDTDSWNAVVTVRDSGKVRVYGGVTITEPLEIGEAEIQMSFTPEEESFPTEYLRGRMPDLLTRNGVPIDLTDPDELKKVMPSIKLAGVWAEALYEPIGEDEYYYLYLKQVAY